MAKELGISPQSLIKNRPNPSQSWKQPVKEWLRQLHEKRFGRKNPGTGTTRTNEAKQRQSRFEDDSHLPN